MSTFRDEFNDSHNDCILDHVGDDVLLRGTVVKAVWNRPYYDPSNTGGYPYQNRDAFVDFKATDAPDCGDTVQLVGEPEVYLIRAIEEGGDGRTLADLKRQ